MISDALMMHRVLVERRAYLCPRLALSAIVGFPALNAAHVHGVP